MLILAERTPNPDALKFLPHMRLTNGEGHSFTRGAKGPPPSPLAMALFALPSVARVYVGEDFVTVTRAPDGEPWTSLRIQVVAIIAEALTDPPLLLDPSLACTGDAPTGLETEIRSVLARHVRPGVARDGGDIVFDRLDDAGVLWVRLEGACGGCPSSRNTLKDAVERIVRRYVPEVTAVAEAASEARPARAPAWTKWLTVGGLEPAQRPLFRHNGRTFRD